MSQLPMNNAAEAAAIRAQIALLTAKLSEVTGEGDPDEKPMLPADATPTEILQAIPPIEYTNAPPEITPEQHQARERSILEGERLRNAVARGFDVSDAVTSGAFEVPELRT
jgi:hypothetical protein